MIRIFSLLCFLTVTACATGSTMAVAPPVSAEKFSAATLVKESNPVVVPPEMQAYFDTSLAAKLHEQGEGFSQGDGLVVKYKFLQFDEGNRAVRYIVGFGAGKGAIGVEVTFENSAGEQLGQILVGGEISMGVAGGSIKQALDRAAMEATEYAVSFFK